MEVVFRHGFGLSWIELGRLIEVVGEGFLGGLVGFPLGASDVELGLRWPPGRMEEGGRSGLADVGEDLGDGLGVSQECDERERCLTGGTDQGEGFIDPGQEGGPSGRPGRGGVGWLGWGCL
jgi:hypothetical protein